jgi:hypothetical protein
VLLLGATFFATRNARETTSDSKPTATQSQQQPASAAKPKPKAKAAQSAAKPAKAAHHAATRHGRRSSGLAKPAAVSRAIAKRRVVVLAFFQPGADDHATAAAVAGVRGERGVAVFTDRIGNVGHYGPIVEAVGIDQAPAVVIVDSHRRARLIQGYVDPETLAQEVRDVRR